MLKGKSLELFETWLNNQEVAPYFVMFDSLPKIIQCAYIIDWFDNINIIFEIQYERNTKQYFGSVTDVEKGIKQDVSGNFKSRVLAMQKAIEIAVELINNN